MSLDEKDKNAVPADDTKSMSAEEMLEKYDPEAGKRKLTGFWDKLISSFWFGTYLFGLSC